MKLRPDAAVLAATFLFCLLATMLFSLGPALKATRADLVNDLKQQVGEPARIGRFSRFFAPATYLGHGADRALAHVALSPPVYFSGARSKPPGSTRDLSRPAILITEFDFSSD